MALPITERRRGRRENLRIRYHEDRLCASKILSFVLANDGALYISIDHTDAVIVVRANGTVEPMYKNLLPKSGGQLAFGNGTYFYLNMTQMWI